MQYIADRSLMLLFLVAIVMTLMPSAHAFVVWPHEDCNTWTEINTDYTITTPDCYVITSNINQLNINVDSVNRAVLVIDLNGNTVSQVFADIGAVIRNVDVEFMGGSINYVALSNATVENSSIYLYDLNLGVYGSSTFIYNFDRIKADRINFTGYSLEFSIFPYDKNMIVEINNASITTMIVMATKISISNTSVTDTADIKMMPVNPDSYIELNDVNLPRNTHFSGDASKIFVSNTYLDGVPLEVVTDPATMVAGGAYIINAMPITVPQDIYYLAVTAYSDTVDVNGLSISTLSLPSRSVNPQMIQANFYDSNIDLVVSTPSSRLYLNIVENSRFRVADGGGMWTTSVLLNSWIRYNVSMPPDFVYIYKSGTDTVLEGNGTSLGADSLFVYTDGTIMFDELNVNVIRISPAFADSNVTLEVNRLNMWSTLLNTLSIYFSNTNTFTLSGATISDGISTIVLSNYTASPVAVVLKDVTAINPVQLTCNGDITIYFEGTTDQTKFTSTTCTIGTITEYNWPHEICTAWTEINTTGAYTITADGCYRVLSATDISIEPPSGASLVVIDLNGNTVNSIYNISNDVNVLEIMNGTVNGAMMIKRARDTYLYEVNVSGAAGGVVVDISRYYTDGKIKMQSVRTLDDTLGISLYYYTIEMNDVYTGQLDIRGVNFLTMENMTVVERFTLYERSTTSLDANLIMRNVYLPVNSLFKLNTAHLKEVNNVFIEGVPLVVEPTYFSPGGAYLTNMITTNTFNNVHFLGITNVTADFNIADSNIYGLSFVGGAYSASIYNSNVQNLYMIGTIKTISDSTIYGKYGTMTVKDANIIRSDVTVPSLNIRADTNTTVVDASTSRVSVSTFGLSYFSSYGATARFDTLLLDTLYSYRPYNLTIEANNLSKRDANVTRLDISLYCPTPPCTFPIELANFRMTGVDEVYVIPWYPTTMTLELNITDVYPDRHVTFVCDVNTTVYLNGTTPAWLFSTTDPDCTIVDNTIKPNLTISSTQAGEVTQTEELVEYNVTVTSQTTPLYDVVVRAYVSGPLGFTATKDYVIDYLPAGGSVTVTFEFNLFKTDEGPFTIYAMVDPDNNIPETNESDNRTPDYIVTIPATIKPQAPELPSAGAGVSGVTTSETVYVYAPLNQEDTVVLTVYWTYPFEVKAFITYIAEKGEIYGPTEVTLSPGPNRIQITIKPHEYGVVGKVVIKAGNYKTESLIVARPLAQYAIPPEKAIPLILLIFAILYLMFWRA